MLVLGNTWRRSWRAEAVQFLQQLTVAVIISCLSVSICAETDLLYLRKGPGAAFPVVFEISSGSELHIVATHSDWVLVRTGSCHGWLPVARLSAGPGRSAAQVWSAAQASHKGKLQLEAGTVSNGALQVGASYPLAADMRAAVRFERKHNGDDSFHHLTLGAEKQLNAADRIRWFGFAGVGVGSADAKSSYWQDEDEKIEAAFATLTTDIAWRANHALDIRLRLQYQQAFDADNAGHPSAALIWNYNL